MRTLPPASGVAAGALRPRKGRPEEPRGRSRRSERPALLLTRCGGHSMTGQETDEAQAAFAGPSRMGDESYAHYGSLTLGGPGETHARAYREHMNGGP